MMIPAPYRWLSLLGLILAAAGFGWVQGAASEASQRDLQDARRDVAEQRAARSTETRRRETADAGAESLHRAATSTQEKTRADQTDRARLAADYRTGTARLYAPAAKILCHPPAAAAAAGQQHDGASQAELQGETAAALVELAGEADDIVRQLQQCQHTVIRYREIVADWSSAP